MVRPGIVLLGLCGALCLVSSFSLGEAAGPANQPLPVNKSAAMEAFQQTHPGSGLYFDGDRITRVYGAAFSEGANAIQAAEKFRNQEAGMWGILPDDLSPVGPFEDGHHVQPIMYDQATGLYKFTGVYYQQVRDGIPVFNSRMMVLARNEPGNPVVMAAADLRDIGAFHPAAAVNAKQALATVQAFAGKNATITEPTTVIWAGTGNATVAPVLALQYVAEGTSPGGAYFKELILVDASTGAIVHQESLIHDIDVTGNVSGMATTGFAADVCNPEVVTPLPYAKVSIGLTSAFADVNGNFTIPNAGAIPVTVNSTIAGNYFTSVNNGGANASLSSNVTPPGPANFVHNALNTDALNRAEVNCYISANKIRDLVIATHPGYPTIATQSGGSAFPINVNIANTCNAFYNGTSINFYQAGGGCNNTGFSNVVYHEYGHHVVSAGGSGQGAFGEGNGDIMGILIDDQPCLGDGFQNCGSCLRTADNACQYDPGNCSSCGSEVHACGNLISGCAWSVRNNLAATNPLTYRNMMNNLVINAILAHTGSSITPAITITWLTLDDNDADIGNGTPHYTEINGGFTAHNMPGPALAALTFQYPNGKPAYVAPGGGTTMRVNVGPLTGTPAAGTGKFFYNIGAGFVQGTMNVVSPNVYDAVFPAAPCGTDVKWYVTAQTTAALTVASPANAPTSWFSAISASGLGTFAINDTFESNLGWVVTGGATTGGWDRGIPYAPCDRGNPLSDADGSGQCYTTQNSSAALGCDTDVDGGSTTLTSPNINASSGAGLLSYSRWYSNTYGASPEADVMVVEFSVNGGTSWLPLETVGPTLSSPNPEVDGGWFTKSFSLSSLPGFVATSQFKIRFTVGDLGSGSVVEAGIDAVKLQNLICTNPCPSDVNGTGAVNIDDLLAVINAWGPCPGCPADVNGNGTVNIDDLLAVINAWGACP